MISGSYFFSLNKFGNAFVGAQSMHRRCGVQGFIGRKVSRMHEPTAFGFMSMMKKDILLFYLCYWGSFWGF